MTQKNKRERGSAMVEGALVVIVFLTMLLAVFDFGQVLFLHATITERVRSALRWGVVNTYDATAIQNYVLYGQSTAPQQGAALFSMTPSMVSVQRLGSGTTADRVVVTVSSYNYKFLLPYIAGTKTGATIVEVLPYEGQ